MKWENLNPITGRSDYALLAVFRRTLESDRDDLAIHDEVVAADVLAGHQTAKGCYQIREAACYLVQGPRKQRDPRPAFDDAMGASSLVLSRRDVDLNPDAIKFVLDIEFTGHLSGDVLQFGGGCCQHEFDWMKEPHAGLIQMASAAEQRGFADITGEHVRPLDLGYLHACKSRQGVLNRAFLQADPQVSREQFDKIPCLQRRRSAQQTRYLGDFEFGPGRGSQLGECRIDLCQGQR